MLALEVKNKSARSFLADLEHFNTDALMSRVVVIQLVYQNMMEQKAALYMRKNNISDATVYHNNTNGTCGYCNTMTATFLTEGATLTVVPPKNAVANNSRAIDYVKTYTGTSNDPKISSRYKGN